MNSTYTIRPRIGRDERELLLGQKGLVIWFTGLSGSGKSTLAVQVEAQLHARGIKTFLLDGDEVRNGLSKDLGFSAKDREENLRRVAEICRLLIDGGLVVLCAFISPFQADRERVRNRIGEDRYFEVFVDAPLEVCEQRDVKGIYQKARNGLIRDFTGIDSPYEVPTHADVVVPTDKITVGESVELLMNKIGPRIMSK